MDLEERAMYSTLGVIAPIAMFAILNAAAYKQTMQILESGTHPAVHRITWEHWRDLSPGYTFMYYATMPGRELAFRQYE